MARVLVGLLTVIALGIAVDTLFRLIERCLVQRWEMGSQVWRRQTAPGPVIDKNIYPVSKRVSMNTLRSKN